MASDGLRLFHGGVPGLRPGDRIEPGHPRGPKRLELGLLGPLGGVLDPPTLHGDVVYLTTSRLYAARSAHMYPVGDLYRVQPLGEVEPSSEDGIESFIAPAARVIAAVARAVRLSGSELRRVAREERDAWQRAGRVVSLDVAETARLADHGLFTVAPAGLAVGSTLARRTHVTNSARWARAKVAHEGGAVYRVEPIGQLDEVSSRGRFVLGFASSAVILENLSAPPEVRGAA